MIKLVAFDWNGTLFADTNTAVKADNIVLEALEYKPISVKKFREAFDIPIKKYWRNIGISETSINKHSRTLEDSFLLNYEPLADKTRTRAGSKQVLKWLRTRGIKSIIYSNHIAHQIHKQLVRLGIDKHIVKTLARPLADRSIIHARTKEKKLRAFVREHDFRPREVISVGDTEEEIEIGKKLGFHTVAITGGYNTISRLKKHHPDFLIHNMTELKKIVLKLK